MDALKQQRKNSMIAKRERVYTYGRTDIATAQEEREDVLAIPNDTYPGPHIDNVEKHSSPPKPSEGENHRAPVWRWAVTCVVLLLCLGGMVGSAVVSISLGHGWPNTAQGWGEVVGSVLLSAGLPDLHNPIWRPISTVMPSGGEQVETMPHEESTEAETLPPAPPCVPVVNVDMSLSHLGVAYWQGDEGCIPPAVGDMDSWLPSDKRGVLVVCSRPYAVYSQGETCVPVSGGEFAVAPPTHAPHELEGVYALGKMLVTYLKTLGIDAVMLDASEGSSYVQTYQATKEAVLSYLNDHDEIGVVLDIGRSGELLPDGSVPRSSAVWEGMPSAQLQITLQVGRGVLSSGDYTLAKALRQQMFEASPTLSRPICLHSGVGWGDEVDVPCLALALGTAGNTFEEAVALLPPLADALGEILT